MGGLEGGYLQDHPYQAAGKLTPWAEAPEETVVPDSHTGQGRPRARLQFFTSRERTAGTEKTEFRSTHQRSSCPPSTKSYENFIIWLLHQQSNSDQGQTLTEQRPTNAPIKLVLSSEVQKCPSTRNVVFFPLPASSGAVTTHLRRQDGEVSLATLPPVHVVNVSWLLHEVAGHVVQISISVSFIQDLKKTRFKISTLEIK